MTPQTTKKGEEVMKVSANIVDDIRAFTVKFGFDKDKFDAEKLKFRNQLLTEEFLEIQQALGAKDAEEIVDGLVDLVVIAVGTLVLAGVDVDKAWNEVMRANMSKVRGVKKGRENSGGFDVTKPEGWKAPNHSSNHGNLDEIL